jgi:uncharacterized cupin superfamily protein
MEPAPVSPVRAADVPGRTSTAYPEPFAQRVAGRLKRPLGDLFGIASFGVNLTTLDPGSQSALRHRHRVHDGGEDVMTAGMCAGFAHGGTAHHFVNRSAEPATYLEIGDRSPGDGADYPDDDVVAEQLDGKWRFTRKDGRPW